MSAKFAFCRGHLILFLHLCPIEIVGDNLFVFEPEIGGKIGGADAADADSVSFLRMSDPSRIADTLEVGNILTDGVVRKRAVFYLVLAVFFRRYRLSVGLVEIPGFNRFPFVGDDLPIGCVDDAGSCGTAFFIPISEVFLEFVGIIGSVVCFPQEFPIFWVAVKIRIRTGSDEDGFHLFFVVPVGNFGKSPEIVFDRELIDDYEIPSFIDERDFTAENIVIVGSE